MARRTWMNFFSLQSTWPLLTIDMEPDWSDCVFANVLRPGELQGRVFWFDTILPAYRSAAFCEPECGERMQPRRS